MRGTLASKLSVPTSRTARLRHSKKLNAERYKLCHAFDEAKERLGNIPAIHPILLETDFEKSRQCQSDVVVSQVAPGHLISERHIMTNCSFCAKLANRTKHSTSDAKLARHNVGCSSHLWCQLGVQWLRYLQGYEQCGQGCAILVTLQKWWSPTSS